MSKILGCSNLVSGVSKRTNKPYSGYFLHYGDELPADRGVGLSVDTVMVSPELIDGAIAKYKGVSGLVGRDCSIVYNRNGYIVSIQV